MDTNDKILSMGAYVKGMLDAAASRGVLSQAAMETLLNGLTSIHGGQFEVEKKSPELPVVPPTPGK